MKFGRDNLAVAMAALVIGGGAGFFAGLSVAEGSRTWQTSMASRYSRDMFCYAPADHAEQVISNYKEQLESRRDDGFLWKREYAVVLASAAVVAEKEGKSAEWQRALAACRESGAKTCTEERLREEGRQPRVSAESGGREMNEAMKTAPPRQPWGCAAVAGVAIGFAVAMHLDDTSFLAH